MNICKNCKHWKRYDFSEKHTYMGTCSSIKFVYKEDPSKDSLEYWDYEDYSAGFATGEDFGCIHWETK